MKPFFYFLINFCAFNELIPDTPFKLSWVKSSSARARATHPAGVFQHEPARLQLFDLRENGAGGFLAPESTRPTRSFIYHIRSTQALDVRLYKRDIPVLSSTCHSFIRSIDLYLPHVTLSSDRSTGFVHGSSVHSLAARLKERRFKLWWYIRALYGW